jgi:hypothetical protein
VLACRSICVGVIGSSFHRDGLSFISSRGIISLQVIHMPSKSLPNKNKASVRYRQPISGESIDEFGAVLKVACSSYLKKS